jgi:hypothetical protein
MITYIILNIVFNMFIMPIWEGNLFFSKMMLTSHFLTCSHIPFGSLTKFYPLTENCTLFSISYLVIKFHHASDVWFSNCYTGLQFVNCSLMVFIFIWMIILNEILKIIMSSICKRTPSPFPLLLTFSSTPKLFLEFWNPVQNFWNPQWPSGVPELHPIPFVLTSPHLETHHYTVPSHTDSVYMFSCIPSKVFSKYSLWILPC